MSKSTIKPEIKLSNGQTMTTLENGQIQLWTVNEEPSLTQQQFQEETDVNNVMSKYLQTGEITHLARNQGVYADLSSVKDYQTSLQTILDAEAAFDTLPSELRTRFENNPSKLLEFLGDKNNYDEGVKLGLLNPKETPAQKAQNEPNSKPNEPGLEQQTPKK